MNILLHLMYFLVENLNVHFQEQEYLFRKNGRIIEIGGYMIKVVYMTLKQNHNISIYSNIEFGEGDH